MKFTNTNITNTKEILYNDHYVAIPYDCSKLTADSDGIIKAGTIIPANDDTAIGVLLHDVKKTDDLASKPGGVDFDTAGKLGLKVVWALSLPGKIAPVTSGEIIACTILNILKERRYTDD